MLITHRVKKLSQQTQPTNQTSQFLSRACKFFLRGIELCSIRCKKLVQEKLAPDVQVSRKSRLVQDSCASKLIFTICVISKLLYLVVAA